MEIPKYLVKFFELKDYRHFAEGRIRAGTLRSYRDEENKKAMGARLDVDDGVYSVSYSYSGDAIDVRLGNGLRIENSFGGTVENITERVSFNYWVFCSAIGQYSQSLHRQFLESSVAGYPGDMRLLAYAVFDASKLISAIEKMMQTNAVLRKFSLECRAVSYDKAVTHIHASGAIFEDRPQMHEAAFDHAVFRKRAFFMPEHEFRIAIIPESRSTLHSSEGPLFFQSKLVRDSIVEMGPCTKS